MRNPTLAFFAAGLTLLTIVSVTPSGQSLDPQTSLLWRDPGPLDTKELFWGAGSAYHAPRPPFAFVKEDRSGTKPKVQVADANGTLWTAKFASRSRTGSEVHAEIAASRLLWAFGYFVEEHYFVGSEIITGVNEATGLRLRTSTALKADGGFTAARFERRPSDTSSVGRWDLDNNPFTGSRELSGLKILAILLNNWDARLGNTSIRRVAVADGIEERYMLSDLGTAFGGMPGPEGRRSRWNLKDYQQSAFIRGVVGDSLVFCHGLDTAPPLSVPLEHARWLSLLASQLNRSQINRAFAAAGAEPAEIDGFSAAVMNRFEQLRATINGNGDETTGDCL